MDASKGFSDEELATRRPVWEALSGLFVDTDVSLQRDWRISVLADSPYSVAQLEAVLVDEVSPVCRGNLFSVAGVWTGFDCQWLESEIVRRRFSPLRLLRAFRPARVGPGVLSEWQATKAGILVLRRQRPPVA
ncbi:MAG: hypothetical protein R3E68_09770 [Burkholderiaceae bacterium]